MKKKLLKEQIKAKNAITALATQCDTLCEVLTSLSTAISEQLTEGRGDKKERDLLEEFCTVARATCNDLKTTSYLLDKMAEYKKGE